MVSLESRDSQTSFRNSAVQVSTVCELLPAFCQVPTAQWLFQFPTFPTILPQANTFRSVTAIPSMQLMFQMFL